MLLLLVAAATAQEDEFTRELDAGKRLFDEGRFAEAVPSFARARLAEPNRWEGHTWQAFALVQLAYAERGEQRRKDLLDEVRALTGPLVKQCGLNFSDPLRHYLLGLADHGDGEIELSFEHFKKARAAGRDLIEPYRGIQLDEQVARAYGRAAKLLATRLVLKGEFSRAHPLFRDALTAMDGLSETERDVRDCHQALALTSAQLGRTKESLVHFNALLEIEGQDRAKRYDLLAAIATVHFQIGEVEQGNAALAKIPADVRQSRVVEARCRAKKVVALRAPASKAMLDALAFLRESIETLPAEERFQLVADYVELVIAQQSAPAAELDRALVENAIGRLSKEVERRPECPSFYLQLQRCHELLGEQEKAARNALLHEQKKRAFEGQPRFDSRGRPRCPTSD